MKTAKQQAIEAELIKSCSSCINYWQGTQGVNCCELSFKPAFIAYNNFTKNNELSECPNFEYKPITPELKPIY